MDELYELAVAWYDKTGCSVFEYSFTRTKAEVAALSDDEIQIYAETVRLKAIRFLTEARHKARPQ
jgi:hypothetical protein